MGLIPGWGMIPQAALAWPKKKKKEWNWHENGPWQKHFAFCYNIDFFGKSHTNTTLT